jgi:hypothetical protein
MVTRAPDRVQSVDLDALALLLAPPVLQGADDLGPLRTAFPDSRVISQVEGWDLSGAGLETREGRTFRLELGLGVAGISSFDACRRERGSEKERSSRTRDADLLAVAADPATGELPADFPSRRQVVQWSAKSRARMVRTFASLDYQPLVDAPGDLAMVTLTYPDRWQEATADLDGVSRGRVVKRHLEALKMRWRRTFGSSVVGLWKLEFQRRGAPHFHVLLSVPATTPAGVLFQTWLAQTWVDVVSPADPDERARMLTHHLVDDDVVSFGAVAGYSDHKRVAVYFLKHSAKGVDKEYQHVVPVEWHGHGDGPGRFWGFWGLDKPAVLVDLDLDDFIAARRVLRRAADARRGLIAYQRARHAALQRGAAPAESVRAGVRAGSPPIRSLGAGGQLSGGWHLVNDGVAFGADLARFLVSRR